VAVNEYDVVVVGAGPAGSAAAKTAAKHGLKTILLEEHMVIGVPVHCSGFISGTIWPALIQEILKTTDKNVIVREYETRRIFAPSGRIVKEVPLTGTGSYLVRRDYFDQELVRQAVNAGADLRLNTRVTGIFKQDSRIVGVTTGSSVVPDISAKIVIATDGINAAQKGIPKWEGLTKTGQTFTGGIALELTRVRDIDPAVTEYHTGAFIKKGWTTIHPIDSVSCVAHFMTMAEFENVKTGRYALSRKLRDAIPIRITGYRHTSDLGIGLPRLVEDGLILAGSSANFRGILPAMISGRYAAEVAAMAIRENDVTANKLSQYEVLCEVLRRSAKPFIQQYSFYERSDEDIERLLTELIDRNEFP
jgi:digeranylgeranylglycerophospholipid reductase